MRPDVISETSGGRRVGKTVVQILGWVLIVAGLGAYGLVFQQTLKGFEGAGLEKALITFWTCVYGFAGGIGTVLVFAGTNEKRSWPRVVLTVYVVLLTVVIVSAVINAK